MPDNLRLQDNLDSSIFGFIDGADESGIHGWACNREFPGNPISLLLHIDNVVIAEVPCGNYRPDVERGGHGSAHTGFFTSIPRDYFDGQIHRYFFTTKEGRLVCLHTLSGGPEIMHGFRVSEYFDYPFYRQYYDDARHMSRAEAFRSWSATRGTDGERFANEEVLLSRLERAGGRLPPDFSVVLFRFLTGTPDGAGASDAVTKFLEYREHPERTPAEYSAACDDRVYTSFKTFLRGHGITSNRFLSILNVADYIVMNPGQGLCMPLQCAQHFVTLGRPALAALSFRHKFDYDFVTEYDGAYAVLTPGLAYLSWINEGLSNELAPNRQIFLSALGLNNSNDFPTGFDAGIYLARNPDLRASVRSRWAALAHYINTGAAEGRQGCEVVPAGADVHRAAADGLAVAGQLQPARHLYEQVLTANPQNVLAQRHYGDCLLRLNEFSLAAGVYERTIASGIDNVWTHINLSICYTKLQLWSAAVAALRRICTQLPGDAALRERYESTMREAFEALSQEAQWRAEQGFYAAGREKMREACTVLTSAFAALGNTPNQAKGEIRRLAIIADVGLPQCNFYRVQQKREQAEQAGLTCEIFNYVHEASRFAAIAPQFDALILYRVPALPAVMDAIYRARHAGLPVFYEIDDLMFEEDLFPDSFESYAGQISHGLYASLVNAPMALKAVMSVCDYAIASTPALAAAMQPYVLSRQAFVHRNALGPQHEAAYKALRFAKPHNSVRIFYGTGTAAHNEDFAKHLAPRLAAILKKWGKKVELYIVGYLSLPACLKPYTGQITMAGPNWNLQAYWRTLGEMDINLAVLTPGVLTDCKSEIKWLEAAMMGIPSIVSATSTYRDVISHRQTGLLVYEDDDWFTGLELLIENSAKHREIGAAAREVALREYAPAVMAQNLTALLAQVVAPARPKRRKILLTHVFFHPQLIGGATRVVMDNLRDLMAQHGDEFEFEIFTTVEGASTPYRDVSYMWEGCRVNAVTTPALVDLESRVWDERMGTAFATVLERFQPDLVHFHCLQRITISAPQAARERGIPYVITVHDGWWLSDEQFLIDDHGFEAVYDFAQPMAEFKRGGAERLERMRAKQICLNQAEKILAVSRSFENIYRTHGFTNTVTIENGVSALAPVRRQTARDGRVRLAHIGGARPHKGFHLVRAALSAGAYENLSLLVVDHEMDVAARQETIWGSTPVTLQGKVPQDDVGGLYGQIDVLLAPSVWPESYGLVVREAIGAGCWVVASDRGAVGQDVTPETGMVIDVSSYTALATAFARIDADPERYRQSPATPGAPRQAQAQAGELAALFRQLIG